MTRELLVRSEAEKDIEEAFSWYEEQRSGMGAEFLLCHEEEFRRVQQSPETYSVVHRSVRRHLIRRFPYGISYILEADRVVVFAVMHGHRNPNTWRSRS